MTGLSSRFAPLICKIFGHRMVAGPLRFSPWTTYTHSQDERCARCSGNGRTHFHYFDALSTDWPQENTNV